MSTLYCQVPAQGTITTVSILMPSGNVELMQSPSRISLEVILALSGVLSATGVARISLISRIRLASESQPKDTSDMTRNKAATVKGAPFVPHVNSCFSDAIGCLANLAP